MTMNAVRVRPAAAAVLFVCMLTATHALAQPNRTPLPLEPLGSTGEAIFPAFEGWGPHQDGSIVLLLGYYNRNKGESVDVPIGPNNRIEPGGPDYGQPTHFEPSQHHGVFAIRVPKDFGNNKLTWTITVNGQTTSVAFWTNPAYWIDFFAHAASGNKPPVIKFAANGPELTGPPLGFAQTLSAAVGQPVQLKLWASDAPALRKGAEEELAALRARGNRNPTPPAAIVGGQVIGGGGRGGSLTPNEPPDITVNWRLHRAPGNVTFEPARVGLHTKGDPKTFLEATTVATFDAPGEYILRAQVNDDSGDGGGGDQCCWTTAHVKVTVK
jgi:hypothetical protein